MTRELARFMKAGGDPLEAVRQAVHWAHDRLEFGTSHAVATAADWLDLRDWKAAGDPVANLAILTEVIGHFAWDCLREPRYPYPEGRGAYEPAVSGGRHRGGGRGRGSRPSSRRARRRAGFRRIGGAAGGSGPGPLRRFRPFGDLRGQDRGVDRTPRPGGGGAAAAGLGALADLRLPRGSDPGVPRLWSRARSLARRVTAVRAAAVRAGRRGYRRPGRRRVRRISSAWRPRPRWRARANSPPIRARCTGRFWARRAGRCCTSTPRWRRATTGRCRTT